MRLYVARGYVSDGRYQYQDIKHLIDSYFVFDITSRTYYYYKFGITTAGKEYKGYCCFDYSLKMTALLAYKYDRLVQVPAILRIMGEDPK